MSTPTASGPVPADVTTASTVTRSGRAPNRFGSAPKLLTTSLIGFILLVATTLATLAVSGLSLLSDSTSEQFAAAIGLIVARGAVYLLAMCWGAAGVVIVARRLLRDSRAGRIPAIGAIVFSAVSVLAVACQVILPWCAVDFTAATFGDTRVHDLLYGTSLVTIWSAIAASACVALAVRAAAVRPGFMLVWRSCARRTWSST